MAFTPYRNGISGRSVSLALTPTQIAARDAALAAQAAAEAAQGLAETAQTGAETAKSGSEDARDAAVVAQGLAEDAQAAAEAVGDTNDTIMASRANDPASAFRGATDSLYAGVTSVNARAHLATPGATAAENRTILAAAANAAASAGAPLSLRGAFPVTGGRIVPTGAVTIDATRATLTQTDNLTTIIELPSGSRLFGGTFVGKGTDFVDSTAVLPASAVSLAPNADDVILMNVRGTGFAGGGVRTTTGVSRVKLLWCDFAGVGTAGGIVAGTSGTGGGLVVPAQGTSDLTIIGGSYVDFPQGLSLGSIDGMYVGGGVRINGAGQHGAYFGSVSNGVMSGFRVSGALEGVKAQISDVSALDGNRLVVGQGVVTSVGSHGIHITNTQPSKTNQHRQIVVSDISIQHAAGGTGDGVLLESVTGGSVGRIRSKGGRRALRVQDSSRIEVNGFHGEGYGQTGIYVNNTTRSSFNRFSLTDGSTEATDNYSVLVTGATSADLEFSNGRMMNGTGAARYLMYVANGDLTKMSFANLVGEGASEYGFRGIAATACRMWIGNDLQGATARFLSAPTNAAAITDTSGATLTAVETEVNKLKARLRLAGIVAP